ncbi:hypothetical protein MRI28_28650 [Nocardiopsis dassonvillei]|uniref:hypothetical protein n=1 Tax=Nocardiopsis dassonvillei TaxID=2014 RepID=UPI00200E9671|nr:hypothetical protein [Nocardiopsis dassonvillei]MCK9873543.1 hypothetical protein [Nocardiopsis dassonvillei]
MRKKAQERREVAPITAEQIQKTVQDAKTLASIPGQELLEDPALNPRTRARYDELTAARLEATLDLDHRRKLSEAQEAVRRAEEQAEVDKIIASARRATSPARTILDMTRHQKTFGRVTLAASLALSVGSAMGLAALVAANGGPEPVGYLAEVGLTGLSTTVIVWRGILARAGTVLDDSAKRLFLVLMVAPLLVSIVGSWLGTGPVGAACSIGSALFAGLAYLINTSASAAITQSITKIDEQKAASERPARTDTPRGNALPHRTAGEALEVVGEEIAEQAADYLRSHGHPSERSHDEDRSHEAETERSHEDTTPGNDGHDGGPGQVIPSERPCERDRSHGDDEATERALTAQERRRLEGIQNRRRVADFLYERPDAHTAQIAEELGLGESTVRRIRKELENGGES